MWKKNLIISLSLFLIFIGSAFLVQGNAANSIPNEKQSQSGTNDTTIVAKTYDNPNIVIGDHAKAAIWDSITPTNIQAYKDSTAGQTGFIKAVHDANYMYALIAFPTADHWAAMEFDANTQTPMQDGHDGWVFGNSTVNTQQFYGDVHFIGEDIPQPDVQKDVFIDQIANAPTGFVMYEVQRLLDTHDTAGKDVVFADGVNISVRFASGFDSSTHKNLPDTLYTFSVSAQTLVPASLPTTSTSTSTTPIAVVKAERFNNILVWGSIGFFFNVILINMLIIYHRRTS